ncbi:MAG: DUF433 domain-containing protein [Spirochaetia bacterium]|nr:DUF433 domain-containing protein [Spirochaetia bacterium]
MDKDLITTDKDILGGTPVFKGTRVPVQALFDYLEAGDSINTFLADFPTVSKEQALNLLKSAEKSLLSVS